MIAVPTESAVASPTQDFEKEIRARIDSLSYLPTTAAVAMKFVELGKDPDAEPSDYAKIISSDSSLSSKILALSNSSWAGVRHKVTDVKKAVNLLGLGTVRTLAISYCMTGLHNELRLSPEESQMFWESSLCKAVAARNYMSRFDKKRADEAFVAGLFQDFALPVMFTIARERLLKLHHDGGVTAATQLQAEREMFRMDHAEIGRILAQKLELPDVFVDAVAFHHGREKLNEFMEDQAAADAVYIASLFPHVVNAWHCDDRDALRTCLQGQTPSIEPDAFLTELQEDFNQMYGFFHEDGTPQMKLTELIERISLEVADNTTDLVGKMNEFMQQAAATGMAVHGLAEERDSLEEKVSRDPLTGILNREGFTSQAEEALAQAARYGTEFALAYVDIDKFKSINDKYGHELGDLAIKTTAAEFGEAVREKDLVGRMGGDEFVILLREYAQPDAVALVEKILKNVAAKTVSSRSSSVRVTLSIGLLCVGRSNRQQKLDIILSAADKLMYQAKGAGGNQVQVR
ncbi:MAG: GGDEF domain-containing protein, partial [Planctomycetes bacterium]|nr:GGDEF domain-containing protein [Planctomycetota bacterium]